MNWNEVELNWLEYRNYVNSNWNNLSAKQLDFIAGSREKLLQELMKAYQWDASKANISISEWEKNLLGVDANCTDLGASKELGMRKEFVEDQIENDKVVGSPFHKGF